MKKIARRRVIIPGVLIVVALASSLAPMLWGTPWNELRDGLLPNLGAEMVGAVLTYALFERYIGRGERQEEKKASLIAQMGSSVKDVAIAAAEDLRRHGWLYDGSLRWANLDRADLTGANLFEASLSGAYLNGTNLSGAVLSKANLRGAYLNGANLSGAYLRVAELFEADLFKADLFGADLFGADLRGTYLFEANLSAANLSAANLSGADLMGADLAEADLRWANLDRADLRGAIVTDEQLAQAGSLKGAILPDGTEHV